MLVDVFYDHLLATSWDRYSPIVLDAFTAKFYADIESSKIELPASARVTLDRIIRHDLLGSYRRIDGVERSLRLFVRLSFIALGSRVRIGEGRC